MFLVITLKKIFYLFLLLVSLSACTVPAAETFQPSDVPVVEMVIPSPAVTPEPEAKWTPPVYPKYTPPPILEEPSYIPQGLVDLAVQAVEENTLDEVFGPMEVGRSVSKDEILAIIDQEGKPEDPWWHNLRSYVNSEVNLFGELLTIEADGDNDGVLDLIAITPGGSAGNIGLMFFRGLAKGGYQGTYDVHCFLDRGSYGFILFEGKKYLWSSNINYATKNVSGLSLYEFQNGVPVEEVVIFREVEGYEEDLRQGDDYYTDKLAQMTAEFLEEGVSQFAGTAERVLDDQVHYWGDLNNDGVEEFYYKNTWYPTTYWDVVRLHFEYEEGHTGQAKELLNIMEEHGYAVQTLWCDKEEQGNKVYTISRDGGDVLSADAWQYQEDVWAHLAQVLYSPKYVVKTRAYTQDLNIDYLDTTAFF